MVPDFQTILRPLLELAADGNEHTLQDAISELGDRLQLSESDRAEMLPSGFQGKFTNRVAWAATHLFKAKLLDRVGRGRYRITPRGAALLAEEPASLSVTILSRYPEYVAFKGGKPAAPTAAQQVAPPTVTPAEAIEEAWSTLRDEIAGELLDRIKAAPPAFFERLVVDLLLALGYGGSRRDAGAAIGKSGDGGIDGVISEDRLGLDAVYIQAKRWEHSVGRPELQMFAGSLDGRKATKGVFLTTSTFTADARVYVNSIGKRIVLIDGQELARLMIDAGVGVTPEATYRVVRVDQDYFEAP